MAAGNIYRLSGNISVNITSKPNAELLVVASRWNKVHASSSIRSGAGLRFTLTVSFENQPLYGDCNMSRQTAVDIICTHMY